MKVFVVSDIHIDYQENWEWVLNLSSEEYTHDILILAGDVTDQLELLERCFVLLTKKFFKVLFVPGNHELWVSRDKGINSIEKYQKICVLAKEHDVSMKAFHFKSLSIIPLLAWYDFSFMAPSEQLMAGWADFRACSWPDDLQPAEINDYFLKKNVHDLYTTNKTLISFSHFLPRIDLMPYYIPQSFRYIYPALGSYLLEKQVRVLNPDIHVYGHSHVNRHVEIEGIKYINNAFGYPSEEQISSKNLQCIYEF
jgi:predicted phosphodiesterase